MAIRPPLPAPFVRSLGSAFALLLLAGLVEGCGRSAETGVQPAAPTSLKTAEPQSEPETLAQAEADLEQARLALAQVGPLPSPPPAAAAPAPTAPSSVMPDSATVTEKKRSRDLSADEGAPAPSVQAAPKRAAPAGRAEEAENSAAKADDNPCLTTCKAFASLLRAKDAVCRLDVPNGARCARAEGIVRDATPRVQTCQCSP
jgi:hypothetical protein